MSILRTISRIEKKAMYSGLAVSVALVLAFLFVSTFISERDSDSIPCECSTYKNGRQRRYCIDGLMYESADFRGLHSLVSDCRSHKKIKLVVSNFGDPVPCKFGSKTNYSEFESCDDVYKKYAESVSSMNRCMDNRDMDSAQSFMSMADAIYLAYKDSCNLINHHKFKINAR